MPHTTLFTCDICGFTTTEEYGDGGMINHDNETSDWNCQAKYLRGYDEFCELPDIRTQDRKFEKFVMKHRRIWLVEHIKIPMIIDDFDRRMSKEFGAREIE